MIIPYTLLPSKSKGIIHLPLVKAVLNYKKTHKITVPISALIDSGADVCFCDEAIGTWLGVNLKKVKEEIFTTANRTKFKAKPATIKVRAASKTYDCKFFFTDTLPQHTPIILGQLGFFDQFRITFDYKNNQIEIL